MANAAWAGGVRGFGRGRGCRLTAQLLLALFVLCPLVPPAAAAEPLLQLDAKTTRVALGPWLSRWVDASGEATWAQARQRQAEGAFQPVGQLGSAGYTRAAHWFTFSMTREAAASEHWVLALGTPYLDDIQVWLQAPDGSFRHVQMGDRHLQAGRPLQGREHAMGLTLDEADGSASRAVHRVWIRVRTGSAMNLTAELWRPEPYFNHEVRAVAAWGLVLGLLVLAALLQVVFGLWLRDGMMLAFAFYIGVLGLLYFGLSGLALVAWAHPPPWYGDLVVGAASLAGLAAASLGSLYVLEIGRHLPRGRWFYIVPAAVSLAALPLSVTDAYSTAVALANLWGVVLSVINSGVASWLWWRLRGGVRSLNTLAAYCLGLGATVHVCMLAGLLPANAFTRSAYQGASIVYLMLTLVAMAVRVGQLRHDKLLAQERVQEERRFAAIVAHEFRNPLAGIDRSANLLQVVPDMGAEQVEQRLSGMRRQVARLNTLIDSFLQADAGEQRPLQPQPEPVSVQAWLQALHSELDADAHARLTVQVEPAELQARFDARLITLALHNLIDNALRYSPEDRPVRLTARRSGDGTQLELVVSDQGPGLSAEDLQHLGRPYHRGASAVGRQGSGLGYYFCVRMAQMHGGQVQARPVQPHGLAVTLSLPLRGAESKSDAAASG